MLRRTAIVEALSALVSWTRTVRSQQDGEPMQHRMDWLVLVLLAAVSLWLYPAISYAQRHGGDGRSRDSQHSKGDGTNASYEPASPEPYGGQLFCPVTGKKLGLDQPPVLVQTSIGEKQPTFIAKLFGRKPLPGAVIYVCCPECVEQVRKDPQIYLAEVIADKGFFSFTYATAPAQRPQRARRDSDSSIPDVLTTKTPH
jgi:hypothetical protein